MLYWAQFGPKGTFIVAEPTSHPGLASPPGGAPASPAAARGLSLPFAPLPGDPGFPGKQPGERVFAYQRRHWYLLWQWTRVPLLGVLASTLLAAYLGGRLPPGDWGLWFLLRAPAAPFLLWALWRSLNWENDRYIVTDRRVVHIERVYFLREERYEARLDRIQNVTVEIPGPMAHLFNFGHLILETAGSQGKILFQGIWQPHQLQSLLLDLVEEAHARRAEQEEAAQAVEDLSRVMEVPRYRPLAAEGRREGRSRRALDELLGREPHFGADQIVWRKHWWILVRGSLLPGGLFGVTLLAWLGSEQLVAPPLLAGADAVFAFLLAVLGSWLLWVLADWKNDYYVVTREKVIDVEKIPFIYENRREASLVHIQDVSYVKPSFLAQRLNYGNVRLQTAAEGGALTFDAVPDPRSVHTVLVSRLEEYRARVREAEEARREMGTLRWLARYHRATSGGGSASAAGGGAAGDSGPGAASGPRPASGAPAD